MAHEKLSKLEANAIMRHREEFRSKASKALQPIVEQYMGVYDSGTVALAAIDFAMQHNRARFEEKALTDLQEKFDYLARLLEPQEEATE